MLNGLKKINVMWVLVQVFSMEVVTEIVNLTFTKNCVKLWKKTLLYMKKTANLFLLKPPGRNILVNSYSDPERNCTKPLLYVLFKQIKA